MPTLPTDRLLRHDRRRACRPDGTDEPPLALVCEDHRGLRLAALTASAEAAGLHQGQRLTDARTMCPTLQTSPLNTEQDALFLNGLRRWCGQWTPWTATDGPDGLLLDVTGCAHLFGGEESLLDQISTAISDRGIACRIALAETRGAAWALARFPLRSRASGTPPVLVSPGQTRTALSGLSPAALRLDTETVDGLARLGMRTIGDLLDLPRASLARRFGVLTVRRLDQAMGSDPEPVCPVAPPPTYAVRQSLPDPLITLDAVQAVVHLLLERLCAQLAQRHEGLRGITITLRRADHSEVRLDVGLARPSRDCAMIERLCERPLSDVDAGFGIEHIRLQARHVEPLTLLRQAPLNLTQKGDLTQTGDPSVQEASCPAPGTLDVLLNRLGGRLGFDNLLSVRICNTHIPEHRQRLLSWGDPTLQSPTPPLPSPAMPRPLLMFAPEPLHPRSEGRPPQTFEWRRKLYHLAQAHGPERISPQWWSSDPAWAGGLRDYWWIQTQEGPRLWIFHLPQRAAQSAQTTLPAWSVHGEFP